MGIKELLSWIKDKNWSRAELESDRLVAIQAIRSRTSMISPFSMIIGDCRRILHSLNNVSLFFIKRSTNMAAHAFARTSCSFPDRVSIGGMFLLIYRLF